MKVLQVGKFYHPHPGGMETVLRDLCQAIKNLVELQVLVANTTPTTIREIIEGVDVTRVASWGVVAATSVCPMFSGYVRSCEADIVHIHEPNPLAALSYLAAKPRGKLIVSFHSETVRQQMLGKVYGPFQKRILQQADRIVVGSPAPIEHWPTLAPFREKCVVVPFGIDVRPFQDFERYADVARDIRHQFGEPLLLFVGRLVYYKGLEYLIEAMREIPARLLIIGDGPLKVELARMVQQNGLKSRVVLLGERPLEQLPAYYHACDFFILPSTHKSEAFGIVQLEAMACGKPVISTDLPSGVPWVNQDGQTGLVVPPKNVGALIQAINLLLSNQSLRLQLGQGGRQRVEREFTRERMGARMLSLYEEVLRESHLLLEA
ncbi:MAG: glycosyltransferase [Acidobacteria bacterium]|nr:glycosyltransferase [Acidobacteriota bacterium]